MDKIYAVQAFRGLAALMVVAFHGLSIQEKYLPGSMFLPQIFNLGQTGVDLFFVISGFVMVVVSQSKVYSTGGVAAFLRNRMLRIYPTYWVYYFLLLVVFLSVPGIINSSQGGEVDLVKSFFLVPNEKLPLLLVAWTLTHELWFYIVFAGLLLLRNRMRLLGLGLWLAVIILASGWQFTSPLLRVAFHIFTVEFILGALLAYAYITLRSEKLGVSSRSWVWLSLPYCCTSGFRRLRKVMLMCSQISRFPEQYFLEVVFQYLYFQWLFLNH